MDNSACLALTCLLTVNCRRACEEPNEDVWCLMSDVWCLMFDVWCLTVKFRESASRRYTVYAAFCKAYPAGYLLSAICYLLSAICRHALRILRIVVSDDECQIIVIAPVRNHEEATSRHPLKRRRFNGRSQNAIERQFVLKGRACQYVMSHHKRSYVSRTESSEDIKSLQNAWLECFLIFVKELTVDWK
jgi:hypothetical protein